MAILRICVILAIAALSTASAAGPTNPLVVDPAKKAMLSCHNITGTCLSHGFVCANEQVVEHGKRCDGVEDCHDGTDEFMCGGELTSPLHERSKVQRQAFAQATCVHCNCKANTLTVTQSSSWYQFALTAPVDYYGLGTGSPHAYGGMGCNSACTTSLKITFYRKTGVCRGYLCCARQNECLACSSSGSLCPAFNNPGFFKRCYEA